MSIQNLFTTPIKIISLPNTKDIIYAINKCTELGFKNNFYEKLEKEEAEKIKNIFINVAELFV